MTRKHALAIALLAVTVALFSQSCSSDGLGNCSMCQRPIHAETHFRVVHPDTTATDFCCTRCSLHGADPRASGGRVEVADYDSKQMIAAQDAAFVESSDVQLCCKNDNAQRDLSGGTYERHWDRCLPSVLAFSDESRALAFSREHGGRVRTYEELLSDAAKESPSPHH